jgi:hypothetical protein
MSRVAASIQTVCVWIGTAWECDCHWWPDEAFRTLCSAQLTRALHFDDSSMNRWIAEDFQSEAACYEPLSEHARKPDADKGEHEKYRQA